jgi:hypothetical protein
MPNIVIGGERIFYAPHDTPRGARDGIPWSHPRRVRIIWSAGGSRRCGAQVYDIDLPGPASRV